MDTVYNIKSAYTCIQYTRVMAIGLRGSRKTSALKTVGRYYYASRVAQLVLKRERYYTSVKFPRKVIGTKGSRDVK